MYDDFAKQRLELVENFVKPHVKDTQITEVFKKVPRHKFIPPNQYHLAYQDTAIAIGEGQTTSQPSLIAIMLERLQLTGTEKVLEIGTGSGYQTALLAELAREVISIEIYESLANPARRTLKELGYKNVNVIVGDGAKGFPSKAPYEAIIVAAAGKDVPQPLENQLSISGRIIIPIREDDLSQKLFKGVKNKAGNIGYEELIPVAFLPLIQG